MVCMDTVSFKIVLMSGEGFVKFISVTKWGQINKTMFDVIQMYLENNKRDLMDNLETPKYIS